MLGNVRIAICDDEAFHQENLRSLIYSHSDTHEVEIFSSGNSLLSACVLRKFDIVFLDIEMNGSLGVDVAPEIRKLISNVLIIFVTSYTQYISDAFKSGPFQYLIKPLDKKLFVSEFERALNTVYMQRDSLKLFWNGTIEVVRICDIEYLEYCNRKVLVHMADSSIKHSNGSLKHISNILKDYHFAQVHNSFYVNLKHIQKIKGYEIYTLKNIALPISKKYLKAVKTQLALYLSGVCL